MVYSSVADVLANIGGATFGLLAWKVPYWRHLMRAIYAPLLVAVFYTVRTRSIPSGTHSVDCCT